MGADGYAKWCLSRVIAQCNKWNLFWFHNVPSLRHRFSPGFRSSALKPADNRTAANLEVVLDKTAGRGRTAAIMR